MSGKHRTFSLSKKALGEAKVKRRQENNFEAEQISQRDPENQ
jgi:hypothetical protein